MDRHAHTGFLLAFFVLALMVPPVAAAPVSICNTPMYDGVCCDSTASPTLWPSGNGCCYGGQPYPGPTCPLLQVTPTPSPTPTPTVTPTPSPSPSPSPSATPTASPTPSPTATPTPSPSATPTVTVIPTPTLPPNIRPEASVKLSCPSNLVIASKITLATTTLTFGNPTCAPQVRLNVTAPKGQDATVVFSNCVNGRSAFNVTTPYDGAYTVVANYSGSIDTCVFAIAGTPPQPTPELGWQLILLAALVAGWVTQRNTPKRKP